MKKMPIVKEVEICLAASNDKWLSAEESKKRWGEGDLGNLFTQILPDKPRRKPQALKPRKKSTRTV